MLSPGHSEISKDNIELDKVQVKTLVVLQPLLSEMEQLDETLDVEEFVESCMMLLKTLNVSDRSELLNFRFPSHKLATGSYENENHTFAPQINPVSKAILENDQLYSIPVEERLLLRGRVKQDKIRRL